MVEEQLSLPTNGQFIPRLHLLLPRMTTQSLPHLLLPVVLGEVVDGAMVGLVVALQLLAMAIMRIIVTVEGTIKAAPVVVVVTVALQGLSHPMAVNTILPLDLHHTLTLSRSRRISCKVT